MMDENNKKMVWRLIQLLLMTILYLHLHEKAHLEILEYHSCLETETNYITGTSCVEYAEGRSTPTILQEHFLHSINDIVGYTFYPILFAIFLLLIKKSEVALID